MTIMRMLFCSGQHVQLRGLLIKEQILEFAERLGIIRF